MAGRSGWWEKMIRRGGWWVGGRLLFLSKLSCAFFVCVFAWGGSSCFKQTFLHVICFFLCFCLGTTKNKHGIMSFFASFFVAVLDLLGGLGS